MVYKFLISFLLILAMHSASAQWGDNIVAAYQFKGFSPDLKYAAYEMSYQVPWPGRDLTRTSIFIVDVDRNAYAAKHFEFDTDSADQPGFKEAREGYYNTMKTRFGIAGNNFGNPVKLNEADTTNTFVVDGEKYSVKLTNLPVPNSEHDEEVMVKVDLVHNGKSVTLQAPQKAPDSWGITVDYKLIAAFTIQNKIALFIQYTSSEIEQPSILRQMIVTGLLK